MDNVETAKAALRFWHEEGDGILSEEELKKLREIDAEENNISLDENVTRMNPIEGIWSVEIDGLDESKASKTEDRYQEDNDAVIRLLDIFNIAIPPKYVYRISKVRETVTTDPPIPTPPRPMKVFFPISNVTPILLTEWIERKDSIREQSGFHHLNIRSMDEIGFEEAKKPFIDDASSPLAGVDWLIITKFLSEEEQKRSILIKGLPEDIPASTTKPSQMYKQDYNTVMDILIKIGVETYPLAVHRMGKRLDTRQRRFLQVIFPSRKAVELVLLSWKKRKHLIRYKNSSDSYIIQAFEKERFDLMVNVKIEDKEQVSQIVRSLQKTPVQTDSVSQNSISNVHNNELQKELQETLSKAKKNSIEILLMTAPIDLVQVLEAKPELAGAIRRVHLMGGWVELNPLPHNNEQEPSPPVIWGNFNLNMAPESSRRLFAMASDGKFPLRLYTYRHVWELFEGSVNREAFKMAIDAIKESSSSVLKDFRTAAKSWDEHAMRVMPYLTRFIGDFAGEQFSPADPILVIGLLNSSFITAQRLVKVAVKHEELDVLNDVLEVQIEYDQPDSKIELVTGLDKSAFRSELGRSLKPCNKCGLFGHYAFECSNTQHNGVHSGSGGVRGGTGSYGGGRGYGSVGRGRQQNSGRGNGRGYGSGSGGSYRGGRTYGGVGSRTGGGRQGDGGGGSVGGRRRGGS